MSHKPKSDKVIYDGEIDTRNTVAPRLHQSKLNLHSIVNHFL